MFCRQMFFFACSPASLKSMSPMPLLACPVTIFVRFRAFALLGHAVNILAMNVRPILMQLSLPNFLKFRVFSRFAFRKLWRKRHSLTIFTARANVM